MYSTFIVPLLVSIIIITAIDFAKSIITKTSYETEMFYYEIRPEHFNWTNGIDSSFAYTPSLRNYPDLPHWIHYRFDNKNKYGYLYGTPPVVSLETQIQLDIIGLNKKTYQVIPQVIQLNIAKKSEYAKYEIRFKVNNMNVEDMFQKEVISNLMDTFRQNLWPSSKHDLYVTFLASTSDLGYRLPMDPNDTEGVVVNLGSTSNFSMLLFNLEKEISPLQKMDKCPKDFKRTSVERYFRANGFNLDWCSFKLVELKIQSQNYTTNIKNESSSPKNAEDIYELIESLQFSQLKYADNTSNTFNITLIITVIFVLGLILSIVVYIWYTQKKVNFMKI